MKKNFLMLKNKNDDLISYNDISENPNFNPFILKNDDKRII